MATISHSLRESAGVQERGCAALFNLARDESLCRPIADAGGTVALAQVTRMADIDESARVAAGAALELLR